MRRQLRLNFSLPHVSVTYRFENVRARLEIRAYVLYMLCVCLCVGAVCTRGTQWTSEQ